MNLLTIPRFALDTSLKVAKWPIERAAKLASGNGGEIAYGREQVRNYF